jgi:cytochrome P450
VAAGAIGLAPDLRGSPLLGELPVFHKDRLGLLDACIAAPGDVVAIRLGRRAYVLKRAEDVQHVLVARHDSYPKGPRNIGPRARRIFGTGLMTSTAHSHRRMRVRTQPVFRHGPLTRLDQGIVRGVDEMIDRWTEGAEIDLAGEMTGLTLQTLVGAIFGVESGSALQALEEGMNALRNSAGRSFAWPVTAPGFLPIALRPRRRRAIRRLDETLERLIRERRDRPGSGDDLLSLMMDTHEGGGSAADVRQVRGEALNLILGAHGNVAKALTYTLIVLARHPNVAASVQAEVERVVGDRQPVADDRMSLTYTGMVLAESMRLWPPNALVFRVAQADDVLPTGTRIRRGSKLVISPYVVQRDPTYFPDPERFDPERFSEYERRRRPKYAYFPFGGGPRVCIGQTLSTTLCSLVLARISQRVSLQLAGESPPYECCSLRAGDGPRMRVQVRVPGLV